MSVSHPSRSFWGLGRWLGHRRLRSDLPWVIDRRDGDRWVEFGRYASKGEADQVVTRAVSDGRGHESSFRVTFRPVEPDEARPVLVVIFVGLAICAVVVVVLVLAWQR
jgi:ABC-type nickel/cobalt efflux system permease component RcnA